MPAERHDLREWRPIREIGEGKQGTASLVQNDRTGQLAVRKISPEYDMLGETPLEMVVLWQILPSSKRISKMIECAQVGDPISGFELVQLIEYYPGGDLQHAVSKYGRPPEDFIWHCFMQIAHALDVIHNRGLQRVVHGDIKPDNIFLDRKFRPEAPWPNLKVGDFGTAVLDEHSTGIFVPCWQGPEIPHVNSKSDIWGLGAIIHFLGHGRPPVLPPPVDFGGSQRDWELLPEARLPKALPPCYSIELNKYMMACLEWDPRARITSRELLGRLTSLARR